MPSQFVLKGAGVPSTDIFEPHQSRVIRETVNGPRGSSARREGGSRERSPQKARRGARGFIGMRTHPLTDPPTCARRSFAL